MRRLPFAFCIALLLAGAAARGAETREPPSWGFFAITDVGGALEDLPLVSWSRHTGMYWAKLERPPGSGRYDWDYMDGLVERAQQRGYNLVFVLKTGSDPLVTQQDCSVAASRSKREPHLKSCPVQPQHEQAWKRLVGAIVERYDGDRKEDMPRLASGFRLDIQIENEAGSPNYWYPNEPDGSRAGRALLRVMQLAYEAKQAANPATRLIAPGIIQPHRLARCGAGSRNPECRRPYHLRNRELTEALLGHPESFDAVDVHFFNYFHFDPSFVPDGVKWVRAAMRKAGTEKPIYSLEWTGAMMMDVAQGGHASAFGSYFPFRAAANRDDLRRIYKNLSDPGNEKYRRWFEQEQAREFPKLFTTLLANGVERLIHVQFHDYVGQGWDAAWWNWQGLVRYEGTRKRPVLVRKPVFHAYRALASRLAGCRGVEPMSSARDDFFAYRFLLPDGKAVGVAWTEGAPRTVDLSSQLKAKALRVTSLVPQPDSAAGALRSGTVSPGAVRLGADPVLIEAVDGAR